jgi:hypothetical protein
VSEPDPRAGRPDSDDYDLLTYAEASARLAELLAAEKEHLVAMTANADPDGAAIDRLKQRIALLESSGERYRLQSLSADAFTRRFGFTPRKQSGEDQR